MGASENFRTANRVECCPERFQMQAATRYTWGLFSHTLKKFEPLMRWQYEKQVAEALHYLSFCIFLLRSAL